MTQDGHEAACYLCQGQMVNRDPEGKVWPVIETFFLIRSVYNYVFMIYPYATIS
jgi:hypothetical protein